MRVFRNGSMIIIVLILFCWAMTSFYHASIDIAEYANDTSRGLMFEINIIPFIIFFVFGGFLTLVSYRYKKKHSKGFVKGLWLPDEFSENDEREQQITARACRAAYISMFYAFPLITALLLFYPLLSNSIPYYPIFVFMLLPLTQILTYMFSWHKNYK